MKPGGFFIIPAQCQEGAGEGVGEQRFLAALQDAPDVQTILDDARRNGYPPGQLRDLEAMLPHLPQRPLQRVLPEVTEANAASRCRVGFFLGCAQSLMFVDSGDRKL